MSSKLMASGSLPPTMITGGTDGSTMSMISGDDSTIGSFPGSQIRMPNGAEISSLHMTETLKRVLNCEDLKFKITIYKKCFKANDAITAFRVAFPDEITSIDKAIAFGRMLQRARLLTHVCDPKKPFRAGHFFFRLQCYQQPDILNSYRIYETMPEGEPMELIDTIASFLMKVEKTAASPETGLVDYRVAHRSRYYSMFEDSVCKLQGLDLGTLDEMTRMAVVVNLYNIMMRYAFMKVGVPNGRNQRSHFFSGLKMNIGGDLLSFDEMEHGILRANAPQYGAASTPFGNKDYRARLALTKMDPRIHFTLSCSPMVSREVTIVYPNTLHYDLHREALKYFSKYSNLKVDSANNILHLNKIFHWYKADFCTDDWPKLARFLERNLEGAQQKTIHSMVQAILPPKVSYIDFEWGIKAGNFFPFTPSVLKANEKRLL